MNIKKLAVVILLILTPALCISADKKQEVVEKFNLAIKKNSTDTYEWNDLANQLNMVGELDKAVIVYEKLLELGKLHKSQKEIVQAYRAMGMLYNQRAEENKAIEMLNNALKMNQKSGDKEEIAETYASFGFIYANKHPEKAIEAYTKALELSANESRHSMIYNNLATSYMLTNQWDKAADIYQKSLALYKKSNFGGGILSAYSVLGVVYRMQGKFDDAIKMYTQALEGYQKSGENTEMAVIYVNLESIYRSTGDLKKADEMNEKFLALMKNVESQDTATSGYSSMLGVYSSLISIYALTNELDKGIETTTKAIEVAQNKNRKESTIDFYDKLGFFYKKKGDKAEAKKHWQKSIELCKKIGRSWRDEQRWIDELETY